MVTLEGMNVEAVEVKKLVDGNKLFKVLGAEYKEVPSFADPEIKERKLILSVEMYNKDVLDYYPNKTSQKTLKSLTGTTEMDKWIGRTFTWTVIEQMIHGKMGQVLFVNEILEDAPPKEETVKV